jgi:hypothetical protein
MRKFPPPCGKGNRIRPRPLTSPACGESSEFAHSLQNSGEGVPRRVLSSSMALPNGNSAFRCLVPPSRHRMRLRSASTTAMGKDVFMPCYNCFWRPHVPYLFILILGVNRVPAESSGGCKEPARKPRIYKSNYRRLFGEICKIADAKFFLLFGTAMNWIFITARCSASTPAFTAIGAGRAPSLRRLPWLLCLSHAHQTRNASVSASKGSYRKSSGRGTHVEPQARQWRHIT